MEESIYNLIPKEVAPIVKSPMYKSKFSHAILPTASTFGLKNTKISGVSNVGGHIEPDEFLINQQFAKNKTLGLPDIKKTINPKCFLKKNNERSALRLMGDKSLQSISANNSGKFTYRDQNRKPSVPKHNQTTLGKCKSSKDFIISNAVEIILAYPKNVPKEDTNWIKRKEYGKTPKYLSVIKNVLQTQDLEKRKVYLSQEQEAQKLRSSLLDFQQAKQIRQGLKKKYQQISHQYQAITHKVVNSLNLKAKKQKLQRQLKEIEDDIKKLNFNYIVVSA